MTLILLAYPTLAAAFTKEDLELVKGACLAGESFDAHLKADGNISIKNLEGKGELSVGDTTSYIVSVPDPDKRAEFDAIRQCIKDYLLGTKKSDQGADASPQFLVGQYLCKGNCQRPNESAYITLEGGQLYFTNEVGQKVSGSYDQSTKTVYANGWHLRGDIQNGGRKIAWHNPTWWVRVDD